MGEVECRLQTDGVSTYTVQLNIKYQFHCSDGPHTETVYVRAVSPEGYVPKLKKVNAQIVAKLRASVVDSLRNCT
jgi:hypothetical protein